MWETPPQIVLELKGETPLLDNKLVLKNQPKEVIDALSKELPKKAPIGMDEALNDDSLSISIQPSVSNQISEDSVSSFKNGDETGNKPIRLSIHKKKSVKVDSSEEENKDKEKELENLLKPWEDQSPGENSLSRGSENIMQQIKENPHVSYSSK